MSSHVSWWVAMACLVVGGDGEGHVRVVAAALVADREPIAAAMALATSSARSARRALDVAQGAVCRGLRSGSVDQPGAPISGLVAIAQGNPTAPIDRLR